jgi:phosphoribosylformylglycinamidine synthase
MYTSFFHSYADTLGSAKGWAASILHSDHLAPQFRHFKQRTDTFALGVCNGCQLMSLIGWVGDAVTTATAKPSDTLDVALLHNKSGRYECRWSAVKIAPSKSLLLRRLAGSTLGCWIAHGEGRFSFRTPSVLTALKSSNCVALQYCDDTQQPTEVYPMNPNGSVEGIAGICSPDGRFLAMMPHPERCSEMWQWPYVPPNFQKFQKCPWQVMFDEAFAWCLEGL